MSSSSSMQDETLLSSSATSLSFDDALKKIFEDKKRSETCIKGLLLLLKNLKSKPSNPLYKKHRTDNLAIKKIIEVSGAIEFLKAVGFVILDVPEKKASYLQIEEKDVKIELLDSAINVLEGKSQQLQEESKAPAPTGPRVLCTGGCGFFGDPNTDNYCSVCWKKKHFGVAESKAASSAEPQKCVKGCGFFGAEKFEWMCSSCWKKENPGKPLPTSVSSTAKAPKRRGKKLFRFASLILIAVHRFSLGKRPAQKNRNRCYKCSKKLGIAGIECRCGFVFCAEHRYAHAHDCPFDYKNLQKKKLERENNEIKKNKISEE